MNTGWWEIDIHGCYSLVKIAFAPICACKNNRRIWRHNAGISRSRDVTDQLWWRHNAMSEKTVPDDNCDMSDRWLFLEKMSVKDIKLRVRNKITHSLPWITIFGSLVMRFTNDFHSWLRHSWKSLANRLTRDPKIVIHDDSCIILYIMDFIEEFKIKLHLKVTVSREITKFALMPCILNSFKPGQNGHYDTDDNFKSIFLNPFFCILILIHWSLF